MSRVILLLALLGVAHGIVWGFHHHHDSSGPDSSGPDSSGPDSSGPDSSGPYSSGPDSSGPDSSGPDSSGPDSSGPDSSGPGSSGPDSSGPDSSGPDSHESHPCGHGEHHHHYTWHSQHDTRFQKLSDYVIRADRFYKEFCDRFTPNNVQESRDFIYSLAYTMPQMDPKNIAVKIKHRVLYMYARQSDSKDSPTYVDVKLLPDTLKISDAFWRYDEDTLTINIPYDKDLTRKTVKRCDGVNVEIKDVPQKSGIIYKFGSGN